MTQYNAVINPNVPDAYVNIVTPSIPLVGEVQTDLIAVCGTAIWGAVNAPTPFSPNEYAQVFGQYQQRTYDMGTQVAVAALPGAENFVGVRVTDGTDTAATISIQTSCLTATSKYTGSGANSDTITIAAGAAANSWQVTLTRPGGLTETFPNLAQGLSGNAVWVAIANAINNGVSGLRGPSSLMVFTAGAGTTAPTAGTYTLTGGTDGASGVTATTLIGADTGTRTGMYAFRGIGPHILLLADCTTSSTWSTQQAFAKQELGYPMLVGPAGEYTTPATVASSKAAANIDSNWGKYCVGDWCYFLDTVYGGVPRMASPAAFFAGILAALGPEQSSLNKQIPGLVGTQKSYSGQKYSVADIATFGAAGCDVIASPSPGGNYFAARLGRNCSSNAAINGDNYTRMNTYLAARLATIAGPQVGEVATADDEANVLAAVNAALYEDWKAKPPRLSNPQGTKPYSASIDNSQIANGILTLNVNAQLGPIIYVFAINIQAGQTVQIASSVQIAPQA